MSKADAIRSKLRHRFENASAVPPVAPSRRLRRIGAMSARGGVRVLAGRLPGVRGSESDLDAIERNVATLAELKGVPMKVGQILGYMDLSLPEESRGAYSALFCSAPATPIGRVRAAISESLGQRASVLLARLEPHPIAVASIGQVHRATVDGATSLAVKVRHPHIERAIVADLNATAVGQRVNGWLDQTTSREIFVQEAKERLFSECDYQREASDQAEFARCFRDHPLVHIPQVFPEYCGGRVLTSEFIDGVEFEPFLARNPDQATRDRVGAALFDFYFGSLLRFGFCNCDPHPGNYLICDDGRVAIVDHGCTRQFSLGFIERFTALTRAVKADNGDEIRAALRELDMLGLDYAFDLPNARAVLRWFYGPLVKHEVRVFEAADTDVREVMENTSLLRWRIPAEFLFLVRMRVGLAAVLARLGARGNWWQRLEAALVDCEQRLAKARPFEDQAPRFDVFLIAAGDQVIEVLRELCERCDLSIAEAKRLLDGAPVVVQKRATEHAASTTRARLAELGCTVELRPAV